VNGPAASGERVAQDAKRTPVFATSVVTGTGLDELRAWLARQANGGVVDAGGPLRHALVAAAAAIGRAITGSAGPELAAVDLHQALRALDDVVGLGGSDHGSGAARSRAHSAEALLDRIYRSFCLGK
jgi:tRNA U34 5-carboxymethylaminomethyl modifying GTPase MnmE/TrmE